MLELVAPSEFVVSEKPKPVPQPGEVLIKVACCGICGSDVHGMDNSSGRRIPPMIMGHEASGVIEEVGAEVSGWRLRLARCLLISNFWDGSRVLVSWLLESSAQGA